MKHRKEIEEYVKSKNAKYQDAYIRLSFSIDGLSMEENIEIAEKGIEYAKIINDNNFYLRMYLNRAKKYQERGQDQIAFNSLIDALEEKKDFNFEKLVLFETYNACVSIGVTIQLVEEIKQFVTQTKQISPEIDIKHTTPLFQFHTALGRYYSLVGYTSLAFEHIVKALELQQEKIRQPDNWLISHYNLANLYMEMGQPQKSIDLMNNEAMDLANKYALDPIYIYMNLLTDYVNIENIEAAEKYIKIVYPLVERDEYLFLQSFLKSYEIAILGGKGKIEESITTFKENKTKIIESHYPPIITIAYMRQIKNYLDVKKYKLALVHSTELKKYINKKDLKSLYNLLTLETQIYEAMQDYKKAFFTNKKCLEVLNKKTEIKDAAKLAESKIIYETEQKEKEKEKFKSESLRFQLQSLRSQMNPHFVFNAINSINGTLKPETIDESKSLLKSFARLMRSNLDFAERPKISLEEEIAFLHDYLSLEKNRLDDKMDYEIHFTENIDLDFIKIPSMLIQPYIENSIKHGILPLTDRKGKIGIYFEEKDDVLRCKVKDNGVGRKVAAIRQKTTEKHLGKSTKITENRLKLLTESKRQETVFVNYEDIENKEESTGTIVTLRIML